ncbi:hypothetical protein MUK42_13413 [Musa troglodytarum]|uniref:Uncharacterized protein n=1 Tax=Musa troglodytarum TaxID=320322 RepID=A0A9E7KFX9_9LILI|nr:hypothetical protein MUK42_13413 [Musa troglodytarum]
MESSAFRRRRRRLRLVRSSRGAENFEWASIPAVTVEHMARTCLPSPGHRGGKRKRKVMMSLAYLTCFFAHNKLVRIMAESVHLKYACLDLGRRTLMFVGSHHWFLFVQFLAIPSLWVVSRSMQEAQQQQQQQDKNTVVVEHLSFHPHFDFKLSSAKLLGRPSLQG